MNQTALAPDDQRIVEDVCREEPVLFSDAMSKDPSIVRKLLEQSVLLRDTCCNLIVNRPLLGLPPNPKLPMHFP
jgi:hypothetical protein